MDWLLKTVQPTKLNQTDIYSVVMEKMSPQEHVKLATFVQAVTHDSTASKDASNSQVLSIICNVEFEFEQAALLLLSGSSQPTSILAVLPIVAGLDISISEVTSSSTQPDHLIRMNDISSGDGPKVLQCRFSVGGDQLIEVSSDDRQALKDMISEVRRLTSIANDRGIRNAELLGNWIDRYISRRKLPTSGNSSNSTTDSALSAQDQLFKILSSPPVTPSTATASSSHSFPKPFSIAPDLPEWRQNWLNERLRELESDYVVTRKIKVRVGTWNVCGKQPVESLQDWLVPEIDKDKSDLYVICLQEIDDTSEALIRYTPFRENLWCEVVHKTIETCCPDQKIIKVASQQLVGLLILVYVDAKMSKCISDVSTTYLGTGALGLGNKGATAVRLRFYDTYLTLVNSHLPAFQEQLEARNRDYLEICRRLSFRLNRSLFSSSLPKLRFIGTSSSSPPPTSEIFQTGHLIWAGDLNYRLNMPYAEAKMLASSSSVEDVKHLLPKDQLKLQIEEGKAFQLFEEGNIEFKPTYKFDIGTCNYDTSDKQRIPAYTDRILYLPGRLNGIEICSYQSYPSIRTSDHKPVAATMMVELYSIIKEKWEYLQFELLRELDGLENESLPDVSIEPEGIEFKIESENEDGGGIGLLGSSIFVKNIKKFNVNWQMVAKPGEVGVCEDWLKISQLSGTLLAGVSEQIHFAVDPVGVNQRRRESSRDEVTDVVILSIEGGRDVFLPISVKFGENSSSSSSVMVE